LKVPVFPWLLGENCQAGTTGTTWTKPQTIPARQSGAPGGSPARPAGPAGPVATGAGCWDPGIIAIENGHRNSGFSHLQNGDFPWLCKRLPEGMTGWKPPYMMDICDVFLWYKKHKGT